MFVEFTGARYTYGDEGQQEWHEIGKVRIEEKAISGYYDHTLIINGLKVHVLEDYAAIMEKMRFVAMGR